MKKRLAVLAITGAMAISAVAPMMVSAAEVDVMYVTGAEVPGGPDAGYYVTIPSNIIFTDSTVEADQVLTLGKQDDATALPNDLNVTVTVTSTGGAQLTNKDSVTSEALDYQIEFIGAADSATAGNGTLANGTSSNVSVGSFTGEGTLTGSATLIDTADDLTTPVPTGTTFTDVLTYTITQTAPVV